MPADRSYLSELRKEVPEIISDDLHDKLVEMSDEDLTTLLMVCRGADFSGSPHPAISAMSRTSSGAFFVEAAIKARVLDRWIEENAFYAEPDVRAVTKVHILRLRAEENK